jgi:hypothetical protein
LVRKTESLIGHVAIAVVGFVMMIIGLAMGVTMVLLPIGIVVGLLGLLIFIGGLFGHLDDSSGMLTTNRREDGHADAKAHPGAD